MAFLFERYLLSPSLVAGLNLRLPLLLNCSESAELRCCRFSRWLSKEASFSAESMFIECECVYRPSLVAGNRLPLLSSDLNFSRSLLRFSALLPPLL